MFDIRVHLYCQKHAVGVIIVERGVGSWGRISTGSNVEDGLFLCFFRLCTCPLYRPHTLNPGRRSERWANIAVVSAAILTCFKEARFVIEIFLDPCDAQEIRGRPFTPSLLDLSYRERECIHRYI